MAVIFDVITESRLGGEKVSAEMVDTSGRLGAIIHFADGSQLTILASPNTIRENRAKTWALAVTEELYRHGRRPKVKKVPGQPSHLDLPPATLEELEGRDNESLSILPR